MCRLDEVSDYFSNIEHIRFHPPEKVGWVPVQFSSDGQFGQDSQQILNMWNVRNVFNIHPPEEVGWVPVQFSSGYQFSSDV